MTPIFKLEANKTTEDGNISLVREQEEIKTGCPTLQILLLILILALTLFQCKGETCK